MLTAVVRAQYPIWLEALGRVVAGTGIRSVALARDPDEALRLVEEADASLFVFDGGDEDFAAILAHLRAIGERRPDIRIILIADHAQLDVVEQAFDAGAFAYLLRSTHPDDLAATIRQAFAHSIWFARRDQPRSAVSTPAAPIPRPEGLPQLTDRELQILQLAAAGRPNADVARTLWVTEQTVKFHLSNVYRKLKVSNRTEAAHWARIHGLLDASPVARQPVSDAG